MKFVQDRDMQIRLGNFRSSNDDEVIEFNIKLKCSQEMMLHYNIRCVSEYLLDAEIVGCTEEFL
jgi:hypothetical protein